MDLEFIERVIRLVEEAKIAELELESQEGLRIVVRKSPSGGVNMLSGAPMMMPQYYPGQAPYPAPAVENAPATKAADDPNVEIIKAPMVGTFYRAPSPDSPSFVEIGSTVQNSTVVCILEAMKVMNEIKSGLTGTVTEILVQNGQAVEFGQPLFKVKKS